MAFAYVPPPPEDDFLDPVLFSSQQQNSRYADDHSELEFPQLHHKSQAQYFGGDGFVDTSGPSGGNGFMVPYRGADPVQRVPETPALQRALAAHHKTPLSEDCRLDFSFDTPSVPGGRGHVGLRSINEIQIYRSLFKGFTHFNLVQSKCFDDVMYTDSPMVVSAPTGSGKTVLFELAIVRLLMQIGEQMSSAKIVYVAPIKALCSERQEDWQAKFGALGLRCIELTGDSQLDDYFELQNAQIVATTPEKWDSMTRKWRDHKSLVQLVRLFLIDEVHQLNDESRGPTMEAIVSRMKTVRTSLSWGEGGESSAGERSCGVLRFIAVSATIPNISDIAAWLGSKDIPALEFFIDESHRPVRLRRVVLGYQDASSDFKFDLSLNYRLSGVIHCYSDQKPTLVFCATRKGTQQAASTLVKDARFVMNSEHKQRLQRAANSVRDSKLRELLVYGVGFHHAGMDAADRKTVEAMFTAGDLPVLFSTSTLAMGVNLPAHLVIVKSTMHYVGGMFQEYSESQILQMIGRAGRPQFDSTATAVILTRNSTKSKYDALLSGTQLIESNLHRNLIEHMNAEIVLHTITDVSIALEWLRSTFLYIRVTQNPKHYGMPQEQEQMEEKLQELCLKDLNLLESNKLISMDDGFVLQPTDIGRLMARYCIAFESMKRFMALKGNEGLAELVGEMALCREFEDVHLRVNEKKILNTLNKDKNRPTIRFPMNGKIKSTDMKVNCLIQASLGCLAVQEFSLNQDTQKIFRSASRLCKCLMELQLLGTSFSSLLNTVILHKSIQARLWENSKYVAKQLDKIGLTLSTTLVNAGLTTFDKLQETNPRELELIMNRHPPFGNQIRDAVCKLPRYSISMEQSSNYGSQQAEVTVAVTLVNHALLKEAGSTASPNHSSMLMVGDTDNHIVCRQRISDSQLMATGKFSRRITVNRASTSDELKAYLISLDYVGLDVQEVYTPRYTRSAVMKKPTAQVSRPTGTTGSRSVSPTELEEVKNWGKKEIRKFCHHRCINKAVCGHECCKSGILVTDSVDSKAPLKSQGAKPSPFPLPTTMPAQRKQLPPTPAKKSGSNAMGSYLSELHARTSRMPPTPALKRLKPSLSFDGSSQPDGIASSSSSSSLAKRFSYTPTSNKMTLSTTTPSSVPCASSHTSSRVVFTQSSSTPSTTYNDYSADFGDDLFQDDTFGSDDDDLDLPPFPLDCASNTVTTKASNAVTTKAVTVKQSAPLPPRSTTSTLPPYSSGLRGSFKSATEDSSSGKGVQQYKIQPAGYRKRSFTNVKEDRVQDSITPNCRKIPESRWSPPPQKKPFQPFKSMPSKSTNGPPPMNRFGPLPPDPGRKSPSAAGSLPLSRKLSSQMLQDIYTPTSDMHSRAVPELLKPKGPCRLETHTAGRLSSTHTAGRLSSNMPPPMTTEPILEGPPESMSVTKSSSRDATKFACNSVNTTSTTTHKLQQVQNSSSCSFFTAGPVSQEDEGDVFGSVFAGIF